MHWLSPGGEDFPGVIPIVCSDGLITAVEHVQEMSCDDAPSMMSVRDQLPAHFRA